MGEITRRSFLKITGTAATLVPFSPKWVKAFLNDFSGIPLQKDMTDEQFVKYIEGVLKKYEDAVGVSQNVEILNMPLSFDAKIIRGLVTKGDRGKYWDFMFYDEVKSDIDARNCMAKDMIRGLSSAWKGEQPAIDRNYIV